MIGTELGHFVITSKLGEGGMGAVYRAEDTRLGRDVAIKVLPDRLTADQDRLARFHREARVLASLNHPRIASIYEVGEHDDTHFLVLELAPGVSLAERLAKEGPPAIDRVVSLGLQIAEALETAHEHGIVHRDLKPANIQISDEDQVKVLDFGLAKAMSSGPVSPEELSESPTLSDHATSAGVVLGTAAYMSPEQARGKTADRRSDIWAFGVVLWEMLTGRRLFSGATSSDILAAVLRDEIELSRLPESTPPALRRLLRRCLERDLAQRLQHMGDARLELEECDGRAETEAVTAERAPRWRRVLPWALAAAFGLIAIVAVLSVTQGSSPRNATHLSLTGGGFHPQSSVGISSDGRLLAFSDYDPTFLGRLHVHSLDTGETVTFNDSEGARMPFFSPDGDWVGYFRNRPPQLMKVPSAGGSATSLVATSGGVATGSWGEDGDLVFSEGLMDGVQFEGLLRVSQDGGDPVVLTTPEPHHAHHQPFHLPGGRWLLFVVSSAGEDRIEAVELNTGERRKVIHAATTPRYAHGHLVFFRHSSHEVVAAPMALDPPAITGDEMVVLRDLPAGSSTEGAFTLAASGTLVHAPAVGAFTDRDRRQVFRVDRDGEIEPLGLPRRDWTQPRLSPDGRALLIREAANPDCVLWLHDLERGTTSRVTFDVDAHNPLWHPSGQRISFSSDDGRQIGILMSDLDRIGDEPEQLVVGSSEPESWSSEGRWLIYSTLEKSDDKDLWVLDTSSAEGRALLSSRFNEEDAALSPDDTWLAYASDESGRFEIYVRSFDEEGRHIQISNRGGRSPLWSPTGRELFYQQDDGIARVGFDPTTGEPLDAPELVYSSDAASWARKRPYELLPEDGFLVVEGTQDSDQRPEMKIVLDWAQTLGTD